MSDVYLIHVGKCGGSTLKEAFRQNLRYPAVKRIHIRKPAYDPLGQYFIVVRNPVQRAISAFNWRYKLVVEDNSDPRTFQHEARILKHFGTLDNLAAQLVSPDGKIDTEIKSCFRRIHHLRESISFYLKDFLPKAHPDQIIGVFCQENLNADIKCLLDVDLDVRVKEHASRVTQSRRILTPRSTENLRRVLSKDYDCLEILHRWGKIDDAAYAKLLA